MPNENYIPYGEDWKKEMLKLPKAVLIDIAAKIGHDKEQFEKLANLRTQCRDYLISVPADKIPVGDALENLGYDRDGSDLNPPTEFHIHP